MYNSNKLVITAILLSTMGSVWADGEHYKNTLIGGRASTMGGAYGAISDDASGAYYNPAGMVYASGDSISGSANTYSISNATYKETIGTKDWTRENSNLMPNFFGLVKKAENSTWGFSYVVTDSFEEHQDQIHRSIIGVTNPIAVYVLNLHSQDNTYQIGPSWAYKINPKWSVGLTAYYHYRLFRRAQSQLIEYSDNDDESSYLNTTKKEQGTRLKLGLMYAPADKWSFGLTVAQTRLYAALTEQGQTQKTKGSADNTFAFLGNTSKRKFPLEYTFAVAYFASAYSLISFDLDYYAGGDSSKENVANAALGSEYFINESNALRFGLYTNRTSSKKASSATRAPLEYINYNGVTLGYAYYTKANSITLGTIYSKGSGDAQIYTDSSAIRKFERSTLSFVVSADYGF